MKWPESIAALHAHGSGKPLDELECEYCVTDPVKLVSDESPTGSLQKAGKVNGAVPRNLRGEAQRTFEEMLWKGVVARAMTPMVTTDTLV